MRTSTSRTVAKTEGFVGADLENLGREAAMAALRRTGTSAVEMSNSGGPEGVRPRGQGVRQALRNLLTEPSQGPGRHGRLGISGRVENWSLSVEAKGQVKNAERWPCRQGPVETKAPVMRKAQFDQRERACAPGPSSTWREGPHEADAADDRSHREWSPWSGWRRSRYSGKT